MGFGGHLWATWRSIASVVVSYAITAGLFFYSPDTLQGIWHVTNGIHDWAASAIGHASARGEFLFSQFITQPTTYITTMFIVVRGAVMAPLTWLLSAGR